MDHHFDNHPNRYCYSYRWLLCLVGILSPKPLTPNPNVHSESSLRISNASDALDKIQFQALSVKLSLTSLRQGLGFKAGFRV